jgi:hypothetical protein
MPKILGDLITLVAVILLFGSNYNILVIKLNPYSLKADLGILSLSWVPTCLGNYKFLANFNSFHLGQISSVGVPKSLKIKSIYSDSYVPINKGPSINSLNYFYQ